MFQYENGVLAVVYYIMMNIAYCFTNPQREKMMCFSLSNIVKFYVPHFYWLDRDHNTTDIKLSCVSILQRKKLVLCCTVLLPFLLGFFIITFLACQMSLNPPSTQKKICQLPKSQGLNTVLEF